MFALYVAVNIFKDKCMCFVFVDMKSGTIAMEISPGNYGNVNNVNWIVSAILVIYCFLVFSVLIHSLPQRTLVTHSALIGWDPPALFCLKSKIFFLFSS